MKVLWTVVMMGALSVSAADTAFAQGACLPSIGSVLQEKPNREAYAQLMATLTPKIPALKTALDAVVGQPSYQVLLNLARTTANSIPNGRMLITLPDGTVVVDTARPDDPTNTLVSGNSYQHFQNKTVNENHNTRVAIMSAQQYPCGLGVESKFSTTTGNREIYVAQRLGAYLDSSGTARLSLVQ